MHSRSHKFAGNASKAVANRFDSKGTASLSTAQRRFDTAQLVGELEEEMPVQGKFDTAQLVGELEEEMPVQGKFDTAQLVGELEEEMPVQGKFDTAQLVGELEEEMPVQGKFTPIQRKENNTGMPDNLKFGIESLSGMDMSDVRVHQNSDKPAQLNALAYAQGTDIHVAPGQDKHLAHEAWHVAQQKQGRVQPTTTVNGQHVNDDPGLESEADSMGAKALQAKMDDESELG